MRFFDRYSSVIFDFSGTLSSDLYFRALGPESLADVQRLMFGIDRTVADRWMRGEWSAHDVCQWLSPHLGVQPDEVHRQLATGCQGMQFNGAVRQFATDLRHSGVKTALVTINADVFTNVVVPAHGLANIFDVIVNSADHFDADKRRLWAYAFSRLGRGTDYQNNLLVDDSDKCIQLFRAEGGDVYHYRGDSELAAWITSRCCGSARVASV